MGSFLRILGLLLKAALAALLVLVTALIAYYEQTASEPMGGWAFLIVALIVLWFSFAALCNLGPTRKFWEWVFKLLITAAIIGLIWIILRSAYVHGEMREWYFAAAAGTMLVLWAIFLWPPGNSLFERSWSGILIALLTAWGFALLPYFVELMPWHCRRRYALGCQLINELNALAGPWSVLAVYFVVSASLVVAGVRFFLERRRAEHKELT